MTNNIAPGARVEIRGEEWLVRRVKAGSIIPETGNFVLQKTEVHRIIKQ